MRTFTSTEIDLCKKITEKERREIKYGDYYLGIFPDEIYLYYSQIPERFFTPTTTLIPLWQEHDCLEFLVGKNIDIFIEWTQDHWWVGIAEKDQLPHMSTLELSLLEALLRAVLAVMEGKP